MSDKPKTDGPRLVYTIVCEDVRIEMTRNLSLMGILHVIHIPQTPVTVLKLAVVNHWLGGGGTHLTEARILSPDRTRSIAASQPSPLELPENGGADNVTVFTNVTFAEPGVYVVQTLIDSNLFSEHMLPVAVARAAEQRPSDDGITSSDVVN